MSHVSMSSTSCGQAKECSAPHLQFLKAGSTSIRPWSEVLWWTCLERVDGSARDPVAYGVGDRKAVVFREDWFTTNIAPLLLEEEVKATNHLGMTYITSLFLGIILEICSIRRLMTESAKLLATRN